jgi:hypothetical protein
MCKQRETAAEIWALTERYGVTYTQTETDVLANQVTRLAAMMLFSMTLNYF